TVPAPTVAGTSTLRLSDGRHTRAGRESTHTEIATSPTRARRRGFEKLPLTEMAQTPSSWR
ncbi:hypothetical protein AK812_SmicGene48014, partial [Symbiodinium microadriaticum]